MNYVRVPVGMLEDSTMEERLAQLRRMDETYIRDVMMPIYLGLIELLCAS